MLEQLDQMDLRRARFGWISCTWTPPTRTGAAAAWDIAAGPAAGGTATGRSSRKPDRWTHL